MSEAAMIADNDPAAPHLFRIETAEAPKEFSGWLVAPASTKHDNSIRWTEFQLYRTVDSRWVLVVNGCSAVYHRLNSVCNRGVPKTAVEMELHADRIDMDLVGCRRCRPRDYLTAPDNDQFSMEIDLPEVTVHRDPAAVVTQLQDQAGVLSLPAKKLLGIAKQNDAQFNSRLSQAQPL